MVSDVNALRVCKSMTCLGYETFERMTRVSHGHMGKDGILLLKRDGMSTQDNQRVCLMVTKLHIR